MVSNKRCLPLRYGGKNFSKVIEKCERDDECLGVHDWGCSTGYRHYRRYMLCMRLEELVNVDMYASCIYMKIGKYLFASPFTNL